MAAIRKLSESLRGNCKTVYTPVEYLIIDEMLLAFRGRCKIRHTYLPNWQDYDINTFALIDATNY